MLPVPLDRSGTIPGTLKLAVQMAAGGRKRRGDLLFLPGGPGAPGADYPSGGLAERYPQVSNEYRWVSMDPRGTGSGALNCPLLQRQVGGDDNAIPTAHAITQCRRLLGPTAVLYSTTNIVADFDDLRRALGDTQWSLDGISYGTYFAERYALAHPRNVSRIVLDSIVPQTGNDPADRDELHSVARVFRSICHERHCPSNPSTDLHVILAHRSDAATVFDAILDAGIYDGQYRGVPEALDAAAHGDPAALNRLLADRARAAAVTPATSLSQGAHADALCADTAWPWTNSDSPPRRAQLLLATAQRDGPASFYPFTPADGATNGYARTCERWPTARPPNTHRDLPNVPVLMLGGTHDLSTPIEMLNQEAAWVPDREIRIFPNTGHSQQTYNGDPAAIGVLNRFLLR